MDLTGGEVESAKNLAVKARRGVLMLDYEESPGSFDRYWSGYEARDVSATTVKGYVTWTSDSGPLQ